MTTASVDSAPPPNPHHCQIRRFRVLAKLNAWPVLWCQKAVRMVDVRGRGIFGSLTDWKELSQLYKCTVGGVMSSW